MDIITSQQIEHSSNNSEASLDEHDKIGVGHDAGTRSTVRLRTADSTVNSSPRSDLGRDAMMRSMSSEPSPSELLVLCPAATEQHPSPILARCCASTRSLCRVGGRLRKASSLREGLLQEIRDEN